MRCKSMLNTVSMGKRIKECRLKKQLTVEQLAEKLEISVVFMNDIERGVKTPRMENFVKILNALEITADEILFDSVRADTDIYLNEITKKMKRLDNNQIAKVEKVIDVLIKEFYQLTQIAVNLLKSFKVMCMFHHKEICFSF